LIFFAALGKKPQGKKTFIQPFYIKTAFNILHLPSFYKIFKSLTLKEIDFEETLINMS